MFLKLSTISSLVFILAFSQGTKAQHLYLERDSGSSENECSQPNYNYEELDKFEDIYFGEYHGTSETADFIKCFVKNVLVSSKERVVVSLEMPSSAREPQAEFWKKEEIEDGRSSKAMFELVKFLVRKENELKLDLHFQHRTRFFQSAEELAHFQKNSEQLIGEELKRLSKNNKVIALAGNIHSIKEVVPSMGLPLDLKSSGMFVGNTFTHILIDSVFGGEYWACMGIGGCGIKSFPKLDKESARNGSLLPISETGHDYVYYIQRKTFTASEPADF